MQVDGIGENAAVLLKTVFECHRRISSACDPNEMFHSFEQIGDYLVKLYTGVETERLMLLLLDKKGRIDRSGRHGRPCTGQNPKDRGKRRILIGGLCGFGA